MTEESDWSLKGKEVLVILEDCGYERVVIPINHIETLRQKLLDDFRMNYFAFERCDNGKQFMDNVIYLLNKRFGVKE